MRVRRVYMFGFAMAVLIALGGLAVAQDVPQGAAPVDVSQPIEILPQEDLSPEVAALQNSVKESKSSFMIDALDLRDMDINDVLKLIASKTGLNIIAGKSVQGRVTIFLQNVEVHDALHIILEANDLAYVEGRGIIQILPGADFERMYGYKFGQITQRKLIELKGMKAAEAVVLLTSFKSAAGKLAADEKSNTILIEELPEKLKEMEAYINTIDNMPRTTQVFDLSYAKAEDLVKTITPLMTKDIGHMEFDAKGNRIVVTDIESKIKEMKRVVLALDREEKQVLIEARIVQVGLTDRLKTGVNWDAILQKYHNLRFTNDFGLGSSVSPRSIVSIGTIDDDQYRAVIDALNSSGKSRILSSPSVAVVNNQEAKILVGTTKPYVTTTTTTPATGPTTTAETVSFIDVGVKLYVTPFIHNDGYVTMKIKPEVSTAANSITTSSQNEIPIVDTSTVDTVIRVKDGVTIVIGGLMKDERTNSKSKIPLLGDIPMLGRAFRSQSDNMEKTEIMVFLTPHIITGDVPAKVTGPALLDGDKIYTKQPLPESVSISSPQ